MYMFLLLLIYVYECLYNGLLNFCYFFSFVCFEDILLFIRSSKVCEFRMVDFDIIFNGIISLVMFLKDDNILFR